MSIMSQYEVSHESSNIRVSTFGWVKLWKLCIASMPLNADLWKQTVKRVYFHVCKYNFLELIWLQQLSLFFFFNYKDLFCHRNYWATQYRLSQIRRLLHNGVCCVMVIEFFVVLKITFIIAIDFKKFWLPILPSKTASLFSPVFGRLSGFDAVTNCFSHFFTPTHTQKFFATEGNRAGFPPTVPLHDGV